MEQKTGKVVEIKEASGPAYQLNELHKERHHMRCVITMYYDEENRMFRWKSCAKDVKKSEVLWLLECCYDSIKNELMYDSSDE